MPNGTPFCTGFKETFTDTIFVNSLSVSSPVQTISQGGVWLLDDYDDSCVKSFSIGDHLSSAIKTDGTLWLWGRGGSGQLGDNTTTIKSSPVQTVSTGTNWKQISSGFVSSGAIKTDGTLWLWGGGLYGRLGTNSTIDRSSPVQTISTGNNWKQVSLGSGHSAAIKIDGTLWLWGNGLNGRLGNNATTNHSSPVQTVSTGTDWKQVSLGLIHSAALKTDGTLWLWGSGGVGRLGNNSTIDHSSPVQTVSTENNWKQVSLGSGHSAAIKIDGTLWLWGGNADSTSSGVLGDNTATNRSSPVQTVSTGNNWKQVSVGCGHSAAIKTDGTLWLWGDGECGRLGNQSLTDRSSPVQTVSTGTDWKQVSLSVTHSSSIKTDGTLWLWGFNGLGALGNNSTINCSSPVQTVSTGNNWTLIGNEECAWCSFSLSSHSSAIKTDGTLWLWGPGESGQLGTDARIDQSSPVQTVSTGTDWKQVSLGSTHSSAIKTDGTLWLWGTGTNGQLGTGSTIDRSSPVQTVSTGTNWKQVSGGITHHAAVKTDGTLWLWGNGNSGRLGNDVPQIARSSPVQTISQGTNWKQVALGQEFSSAIKTDGTLWLWGDNADGNLGNNSTINRSSPVQTVTTGTNWKQVSLARSLNSHSAAIKTDGTLWLWGCGGGGSLGNNSSVRRSSPVQTVSTGTDWKQVSLGREQSSSVKTDGTLWLWGCGTNFKLGNNSSINRSSPAQTITSGTDWKQTQAGLDHTSALDNNNCLYLWGLNTSGEIGRDAVEKTQRTLLTDLGNILVEKEYLLDVYPNIIPNVKAPALYLWGSGDSGRLGNDSTISQSSPVQTVSTGINWNQVDSTAFHSAAIKTDGTLWLWGDGATGQLGTQHLGVGSTLNRSSPVQTASQATNWKQVSLGESHSAAVKTDGTLWLWGCNIGSLGNNNTINRSSPVQTISTGTNWKQVSLGSNHSASVKTDGTLWLWGQGAGGSLGNSSTINRSSPVQTVSTGTNWKQVSLGGNFSASIKTDGTLWLWGCGSNGKLGNDSSVDHSSPVQTVSTGNNWKQVSIGSNHSASIKTDGTLWLWGTGTPDGRLGNNSIINRSSPVQTVSSGTNWKQVSLGDLNSAAIKIDGTLWLWGSGDSGRLGNNATTNISSPVQTISQGKSWKQVDVSTAHVAAIWETQGW